MSLCSIKFQVICQTQIGQVVYICGNSPQLGNWNPENSLRLYTDCKLYPKWDAYKSIFVREGNKLFFKLCIVDQYNNTRWESIQNNRQIIVSENLLVEFTAHHEEITLSPIIEQVIKPPRKKTCDILNELQSDGSSSHQYWKQFMSQEEEESILYITLMTQMRRIVEYGLQQHFDNCHQSSSFTLRSSQFDSVLQKKVQKTTQILQHTSHLYCIFQQTITKNKTHNQSKDQVISILGQESYLVSTQQFLASYSIHNNQVPIIFHIETAKQKQNPSKNKNSLYDQGKCTHLQSANQNHRENNDNQDKNQLSKTIKNVFDSALKIISAENKLLAQKNKKLQFYFSINLKFEPTPDLVSILILKKVALIIIQEQSILQKLLDILTSMQKTYHFLSENFLLVQLNCLATTCIKININKNNSFINKNIPINFTKKNKNLSPSQKNQHQLLMNSYFTEIKKDILIQSNKSYPHLGKNLYVQSLKDDDLFLGIAYHKKNILLINDEQCLLTQFVNHSHVMSYTS